MNRTLLRSLAAIVAVSAAAAPAMARKLTPAEALSRAEASSGPESRAVAPAAALAFTGRSVGPDATPAYYVFDREGGNGFVVTTADDRLRPVLVESDSGSWPQARGNEALGWWLDMYEAETASFLAGVPAESTPSRSGSIHGRPDIDVFTTTTWDQGDPYNLFTPNRLLTGCVATALAQIIYHNRYAEPKGKVEYSDEWHRYPDVVFDYDNTTFDFDLMLPRYDKDSPEASRIAVARLMAGCGAAVRMNYTDGGSAAAAVNVPSGVINHFGYDPEHTVYLTRYDPISGKGIPTDRWETVIYNELSAGRPVLYSGSTVTGGGHAFMCNGYRDPGLFHINWGWSGGGDCFVALTALNSGSDGINSSGEGFSYMQDIVLVVPPGAKNVQNLDNIYGDEGELSLAVTDVTTAGFVAETTATLSFTLVNNGSKDYFDYIYARVIDGDGREVCNASVPGRPVPSGDIARFSMDIDLKGDKGEPFAAGRYTLKLTDGKGEILDAATGVFDVDVAAEAPKGGYEHTPGGFSITSMEPVPDVIFSGQSFTTSVGYRLDAAAYVTLHLALFRPGTSEAVASRYYLEGQPPVKQQGSIAPITVTFDGIAPGVYEAAFTNNGKECSERKTVSVGFKDGRLQFVAIDDRTCRLAPGSYSRTVRIPAETSCDGHTLTVTEIAPEVFMGNDRVRILDIPATVTFIGRDALRRASGVESVFLRPSEVPFRWQGYVAYMLNPEADIYVPAGSLVPYRNALAGHNVWAEITGLVAPDGAVEVAAGGTAEAVVGVLPSAAGSVGRWTAESSDPSVATAEAVLTSAGVAVKVAGVTTGTATVTVAPAQPGVDPVTLTVNVGTAGIDGIEADTLGGARRGIYDLSGRRLERADLPGVYIIDGRKTIVR